MKVAKSFRLSSQALEALRVLRERTGASETALVEMALALLYRVMVEAPGLVLEASPGPLEEEGSTSVQDTPSAPAEPVKPVVPGPVAGKSRKRRKKRKKRRR